MVEKRELDDILEEPALAQVCVCVCLFVCFYACMLRQEQEEGDIALDPFDVAFFRVFNTASKLQDPQLRALLGRLSDPHRCFGGCVCSCLSLRLRVTCEA